MAELLLARLQTALGDRYRLEREVGRGGMATVFLAHDHNDGRERDVALKVLHPELATSLGVERFAREIKTASALYHPHILVLIDSGVADGLPYYVTPYIAEESLRARLERDHQLPIDEAVGIASDIAKALAYAHSRGVIHRDIKPENILFSAGLPLVADFGIAKAIKAASIEPITDVGMIMGTPLYMSPEQASGDDQIDGRSDTYSLGCMLYEMLVGSAPFPGPTAHAVISGHFVDPPPSIRSVRRTVPDALERVVFRALAKVPGDRYATAADFRDALTAWAVPSPVVDRQSVAVLPFANQSGDAAFEYLSDGVAEEILVALDQVPGLRVAARTSSFAFRAKDVDLSEIGAKLNVATVLEGSVRKAANQLRVTARLVNVADGFALWSARYDRDMTDVFAIQDEIAKAIAGGLQVTLAEEKPLVAPPTENLQAYELYLKGRYYLAQRGLGLKRALDVFDQAAALDPAFAMAHAGVAEACAILAQFGLVAPDAIRAKAHAAANRALALAPDLPEAHCASGALSLACDWDWARASSALQRAVELNPGYIAARIWLAFYLVFVQGRLDAGIAEAQRAAELDPISPLPVTQLGMALLGAGRYEEAETALRRAAELGPTMFVPPTHLGLLYNRTGRSDEAIATLEFAIGTSGVRHPWTLSALAVCYSALGRLGETQAIYDELVARARREYVQSSILALLTASLGRMDEAFEILERACDEHDGILVYSKRYPFLMTLQADPRMQGIYRRVGFPGE